MTPEIKGLLLVSSLKVVGIFTALMLGVTWATWLERRVAGWIQDRLGPNRVGPQGLFQPLADGLKNLLKEETYPAQAQRWVFILAPMMAFAPALMLIAVIPVGSPLPGFDATLPVLGRVTHTGDIPLMMADIPVGFLYILAISSLAVYGVALAGWSSNSKYSLLGGLRASAQMISYELALGLSALAVLLLAGNVTLGEIVQRQQASLWFVLPLFIAFFIFLIAAFAESNRLPFDLPEAEAELIAGYHAEYSAMKFSMFFIAEYAHMITASAFVATLFFGGWDIPFTTWDDSPPWTAVKSLATMGVFGAKVFVFVFTYMWVRWTLPRFRYDQLMALGWKVMLPLALTYAVAVAVGIYVLEEVVGLAFGPAYAGIMFAVNVVLMAIIVWGLDRGRTIQGIGPVKGPGGPIRRPGNVPPLPKGEGARG